MAINTYGPYGHDGDKDDNSNTCDRCKQTLIYIAVGRLLLLLLDLTMPVLSPGATSDAPPASTALIAHALGADMLWDSSGFRQLCLEPEVHNVEMRGTRVHEQCFASLKLEGRHDSRDLAGCILKLDRDAGCHSHLFSNTRMRSGFVFAHFQPSGIPICRRLTRRGHVQTSRPITPTSNSSEPQPQGEAQLPTATAAAVVMVVGTVVVMVVVMVVKVAMAVVM